MDETNAEDRKHAVVGATCRALLQGRPAEWMQPEQMMWLVQYLLAVSGSSGGTKDATPGLVKVMFFIVKQVRKRQHVHTKSSMPTALPDDATMSGMTCLKSNIAVGKQLAELTGHATRDTPAEQKYITSLLYYKQWIDGLDETVCATPTALKARLDDIAKAHGVDMTHWFAATMLGS